MAPKVPEQSAIIFARNFIFSFLAISLYSTPLIKPFSIMMSLTGAWSFTTTPLSIQF